MLLKPQFQLEMFNKSVNKPYSLSLRTHRGLAMPFIHLAVYKILNAVTRLA